MKQVIGFATKFYTLWNYDEEPQYTLDSYGKYHLIGTLQKYFFIKNISFDLNKTKESYPGVPIDEDLRGQDRSFEKVKREPMPFGYFWVGKHYGKLISEVVKSDLSYCIWASENLDSQTCQAIRETPEFISYLEEEKKKAEERLTNANLLESNQEVELEFTTNGHSLITSDFGSLYGGYYDSLIKAGDYDGYELFAVARHGEKEVVVKLSECKYVSGMYPYLMPVINGKAQRTKGKTLKVKVREVVDNYITDSQIRQTIKIF